MAAGRLALGRASARPVALGEPLHLCSLLIGVQHLARLPIRSPIRPVSRGAPCHRNAATRASRVAAGGGHGAGKPRPRRPAGRTASFLGDTRAPEIPQSPRKPRPPCSESPAPNIPRIPGFRGSDSASRRLAVRAAGRAGPEGREDQICSAPGRVCASVFTLLAASNKFNINLHFQGNN